MKTSRMPHIPAAALAVVLLMVGCLESKRGLHYLGDAGLQHYKESATQIDFPDVQEPLPDEVKFADGPRTLNDRKQDEIWDLTIAEAIHTALANNDVIRSNGSFMSPGNSLLANPDRTPSVYDPAIQDSGVLFGGRGVESALAAFDATFATRMTWGRNEAVQNNLFLAGGALPGTTLARETGNFEATLQKQFANGGLFSVGQVWNYTGVNVPGQLFPTAYSGNLGANYRQPLWAGAGTEFTRIAGPIGQSFGGISGVTQGVLIARINNDITVADFEANIRNLLKDVEDVYWDLYLAYRLYDTAVVARTSALESWRQAHLRAEVGGIGGFNREDEPQAADQYFAARAAAELTLNQIYATEIRLRRMMGLPVNDGRVIRPSQDPTVGQLIPDWYVSLAEGLSQRVELRKQKWNIKSLELQLKAAKSLVHPRFDFVSNYRVNAFGDRLISQSDTDGLTAQGFHSAYETITQGDQTGWNLGFEFSMPLGFRSANAQVRNIELRLAKSRDVLAVQEMEISHELATAIQNLALEHSRAISNRSRREAAIKRLSIVEQKYKGGFENFTLDNVLRAQASVADAEQGFFTSLANYNKAIADFHFRKGTLLEYNNIGLAEDDWNPHAYREAFRRARARSHAFDALHLKTEPAEFVLPPGYPQHIDLVPGTADDEPAQPPEPMPVPELKLDPEEDEEPGTASFSPLKPAIHQPESQDEAVPVLRQIWFDASKQNQRPVSTTAGPTDSGTATISDTNAGDWWKTASRPHFSQGTTTNATNTHE